LRILLLTHCFTSLHLHDLIGEIGLSEDELSEGLVVLVLVGLTDHHVLEQADEVDCREARQGLRCARDEQAKLLLIVHAPLLKEKDKREELVLRAAGEQAIEELVDHSSQSLRELLPNVEGRHEPTLLNALVLVDQSLRY